MENTAKQEKTINQTNKLTKPKKGYLKFIDPTVSHSFYLEFGHFCLGRKYDETIFQISDLLDFS